MPLYGSKHVANLYKKLMCLMYIVLLFQYFLTHWDDFDQRPYCTCREVCIII